MGAAEQQRRAAEALAQAEALRLAACGGDAEEQKKKAAKAQAAQAARVQVDHTDLLAQAQNAMTMVAALQAKTKEKEPPSQVGTQELQRRMSMAAQSVAGESLPPPPPPPPLEKETSPSAVPVG